MKTERNASEIKARGSRIAFPLSLRLYVLKTLSCHVGQKGPEIQKARKVSPGGQSCHVSGYQWTVIKRAGSTWKGPDSYQSCGETIHQSAWIGRWRLAVGGFKGWMEGGNIVEATPTSSSYNGIILGIK